MSWPPPRPACQPADATSHSLSTSRQAGRQAAVRAGAIAMAVAAAASTAGGLAARLKTAVWSSGLACAALAASIFSFSALQVHLTGGRVPVLQLCVLRSSLSLAVSLGAGVSAGVSPLLGHRRHLPLLAARGLAGTAAISCAYTAVLALPLGDASEFAARVACQAGRRLQPVGVS